MQKLTFFLIILNTCFFYSQDRTLIQGEIMSIATEKTNINILNKNTQEGTTTDPNGNFEIKVKLNDVLIFTSVQFKTVKKAINKTDILNNNLIVKMNSFINELNIVNIKNHNLKGNLLNDSKNVPIDLNKNDNFKIKKDTIDFATPGFINSFEDIKPPDPLTTSETVQSLDFIKVFKFLTKGLRKKRKAKKAHQEYLKSIPSKIREEYGEIFFIDVLKIPKPLIDDFIDYCKLKNIISLYHNNKKYEVITILIKESKSYLKKLDQN